MLSMSFLHERYGSIRQVDEAFNPPEPLQSSSNEPKLITSDKISWLWKPYLPIGRVTVLEGDYGAGKTTLILTIAAMVSRGIRPPSLIQGHLSDEPPCAPITTFFLADENEITDTSLVRFLRADGDPRRFAYSSELQEHMTLTEPNLLSAIEQSGARLLIIDPYQAFLPEGTNTSSITKMRVLISSLSNVARETGASIVLLSLPGKRNGFIYTDEINKLRIIVDEKDRNRRWLRVVKSKSDASNYAQVQLILDEERRLSFAGFGSEKEHHSYRQL